mgnify:FL=1
MIIATNPLTALKNNMGKGLYALGLCLAFSPVHASDENTTEDDHRLHHLDAVSVTASGESLDDVVQAAKVLNQSDIQQASASSLGELLENMPGVSNASFGPGVGRPVIRGLSGNRVKVAVNGSDAADVSAMSSDHAPMAEIANAQQVEVIYGPGTLLYGSGAIGGVVNVADGRFHETPLISEQDQDGTAATSVKLATSVSSVDQGTQFSGQIDQGVGENWVFHLDGFKRESEDYEAPDNSLNGKVSNTATQAKGFNLGVTHLNSSGRTGVAVSFLDYEYGVPNEENEAASVAPTQFRFDALHEVAVFSGILESIKTQLSVNDYEHNEIDEGVVVGFFDKQNVELKSIFTLSSLSSAWNYDSQVGVHVNVQDLALCHDHDGCADGVPNYSNLSWDGSKGPSFNPQLDANGNTVEFIHDTPMPETQTIDAAVFALVSSDWGSAQNGGKQEYAIRLDQRTISSDPVSIRPNSRQAASYYDDKTFLAATISSGWTWQPVATMLKGQQKWGLSLARTERAPLADEMFWNGDHHATFSYQLDNPDLEKETAHTLDVTWQYSLENMMLDVAVYYYDFDGYIFNELQNITDPIHGDAVYRYVQKDAYLTGFEAAFQYDVTDAWAFSVVMDKAVGRLKSDEASKHLPRIPPQTLLLGGAWQQGHWLVNANVKYHDKQADTAASETSTSAYHTINAMAAYEFEWNRLHMDVSVKGNNLTDELGRNHVSYLKAYSPLPGRNVSLDLTLTY